MPKLLWTKPIRYYSLGDEKQFFAWLESIGGVTRVEGTPEGLSVHLSSRRMSQKALRNLIALFKRYGGDMKQLAQFATPENESWFKAPNTYWHAGTFGGSARLTRRSTRTRRKRRAG